MTLIRGCQSQPPNQARQAQGGAISGLRLVERIAEIASDIAAVGAYVRHVIVPLEAIPLEDFRTTSALSVLPVRAPGDGDLLPRYQKFGLALTSKTKEPTKQTNDPA